MRAPRYRPSRARAFALSAVAAGAGAAVALERRYLHRLAHDQDFLRLSAPLGGRARAVASADGTRLHVEAFGPETGPTIVLAHGWTEQLSFWGPVISALTARGIRCVAYDLRGHGRSAPGAGHDYSLQRFGEDLEAVVAAVMPDGQLATVAGHSLGAMSIAAWAEHHDVGARVCAAAMINTGLGDLIADSALLGELAKRLANPVVSGLFLGSSAPIPGFSTPLQSAVIRYTAFGPTATAGQVAFYEQMLIACPPEVRAACGVAMAKMDLWHALARLTVPTLVIAGENDRLTPPKAGRRIAATVPRPAGLIELPATGHMSPLERPDALSSALTKLVSECASLIDGVALSLAQALAE